MKFLISGLMALALTGCTLFSSAVCDVQKAVTSVAASTVASQLSCKNLDAVKASIDKEVAKLNLCKAPESEQKAALGDVICGPLVEALGAGVLSALPSDWECSGGVPMAEVKAKLLDACKKAL